MSEDSVAQLEDASDEDEYVVRVLALVAGYYGHTYFDKQPLRNSITTGSDWALCAALDNADRQTPWSHDCVGKKAVIFVYTIAKNASNSDLQERFQHSGETIHRMASTYLVQPVTPSQLQQNDPKYAGQLDQCRLAFDGTHIPAYNLFAACSAADSMVLVDARRKGFKTPPDLFDLDDAGYGLATEVMTPYRGARYHLKEWRQTYERPQKDKEL
ncbi:putative DDE Tnp4 domain-containing protein [Phytophthora infestans]|uniref:Putative DDE Tnp4 domain-containing protein n=1 Tax=Phytophthora infestans TaxID=4787 RepID=A0A833W3J3_PHYIN|nr:putative DDE Tnp4 domain-containing protein [Phytophthora infestans]